ncbi:hypothetical protein OV079_23660 [Nannocystis pusilla]|uniref:Uncharacterized protein n=1 Tax=Nannocystis pusilla TaxID=889268 RepID=A0A9X3ESD2_9BACT|nr:hypothetical protein [Nannocystis pusilla]MCY1008499.1 hypothetical protein [Nannocystis pusilla]
MYPYTLTGLTAEHFAAARLKIHARSNGPAPDRFWVLLRHAGWCDVPREAMPLLFGVDDLDAAVSAVLQVEGVVRELSLEERLDAEMMLLHAAKGGE